MELEDFTSYEEVLKSEIHGVPPAVNEQIRYGFGDCPLITLFNPINSTDKEKRSKSLKTKEERFVWYMKDKYPFLRDKSSFYIEKLSKIDFQILEENAFLLNNLTPINYIVDILDSYNAFKGLPKELGIK